MDAEVVAARQITLETIENDSDLLSEIMMLSNHYRRENNQPFDSLDQAVSEFGFSTIKNLALLLARSRHDVTPR